MRIELNAILKCGIRESPMRKIGEDAGGIFRMRGWTFLFPMQ